MIVPRYDGKVNTGVIVTKNDGKVYKNMILSDLYQNILVRLIPDVKLENSKDTKPVLAPKGHV